MNIQIVMPSVKSRRFVFTLNFSDKVPNLYSLFDRHSNSIGFSVWQHEKVKHNHLQGYVQLRNSNSLTYIKKIFLSEDFRPHLEIAKGTHQQCVEYSTKQDSRIDGPWYFGIPVTPGSNKRSFIEQYRKSPERLLLEKPEKYRRVSTYIRNNLFRETKFKREFTKPWQIQLAMLLNQKPDFRTIFWVYGPEGNDGKTFYAKKLTKDGWHYTKGGKKDNVMFQYIADPLRNIVVDYPRECKDYVQYDTLEMLKDRTLISNKYEPLTALLDDPIHLVVMANFQPDMSKISKDRIKLITC